DAGLQEGRRQIGEVALVERLPIAAVNEGDQRRVAAAGREEIERLHRPAAVGQVETAIEPGAGTAALLGPAREELDMLGRARPQVDLLVERSLVVAAPEDLAHARRPSNRLSPASAAPCIGSVHRVGKGGRPSPAVPRRLPAPGIRPPMDQARPLPSGPEAAHRVQQALAALRRGAAVVIEAAGGPLLAAAPECLDEAGLEDFRSRAEGDLLLVGAGLQGGGGVSPYPSAPPFALEVSGLSVAELCRLADPSSATADRRVQPVLRRRAGEAPDGAEAALWLCKLAHLIPAALLARSRTECP